MIKAVPVGAIVAAQKGVPLDILSWHGCKVRACLDALHVSILSLLFLILYTVSRQTTIAYLLRLFMDLSVTYFNIVRGIKNQRPRQLVLSTLLALTSVPGGLIRTNKHHSTHLRSCTYSGRSISLQHTNCRYSPGWCLFRKQTCQPSSRLAATLSNSINTNNITFNFYILATFKF
jgi:hypothetical protein